MAMKNFPGDGNHKSYEELYCSTEITGGIHIQLIILSVLNIFFHYCISGKCSDPCRPSQGRVVSSALQTVVSQPGDNGSLCWYHCGTFSYYPLVVYGERTMEYLSLYSYGSKYSGIFFLFSVFVDIVCHKCGQTSRPVVRAQIQTSCNFKANICNCDCFLGFLLCGFHSVPLE